MGRQFTAAVLLSGLLASFGASAANAQFLWTGTVSNDPTIGGNWSGLVAPIGTSGTEYLTFGNVATSPQYLQIPASGFAVLDLNFVGTNTSYYFSGTSNPTLALYRDVVAGSDSFAVLDYSVNIGLTAGNHNINVGPMEASRLMGQSVNSPPAAG